MTLGAIRPSQPRCRPVCAWIDLDLLSACATSRESSAAVAMFCLLEPK